MCKKRNIRLITDRGILCTLKQKKDDSPVPPTDEITEKIEDDRPDELP